MGGCIKIGESLALPEVEAGIDVVIENGPAPAVFEALAGIPNALGWVLDLLDQYDIVEPGKRSHRLGWPSFGLSRSLRDNLAGPGVGQVEGAHAIDVGARKPADSGEGGLQVLAEAVDHCGAPAFGLLPFHDVLADVPVESKEFVVNGEGGLDLGVSDAFFQVAQEVGVAVRHRQ